MIIANGHIEFRHKTGGGIDERTGIPVAPEETWSAPVPCQFIVSKHNLQAKAGNSAMTSMGYTVLIEMPPREGPSEQLRLSEDTGRVIGEFPVISVEELRAVGQIRLTI